MLKQLIYLKFRNCQHSYLQVYQKNKKNRLKKVPKIINNLHIYKIMSLIFYKQNNKTIFFSIFS